MLAAKAWLQAGHLAEAEAHFSQLLSTDQANEARFGLAEVYFQKENYSACNVILETLIEQGQPAGFIWLLYARALVKEQSMAKAAEAYQTALRLDATLRNEELDQALLLPAGDAYSHVNLDWDDVIGDHRFVEKPSLRFHDVGGMEAVKREIDLKIIKPLQHPELYKAYGKKMGGGVLLYGPPGCGKTFMAKATAGEVDAKFISLGLNEILDMWVGNSEKNLHEVFELARRHKPCVLFIDEMDALGASRADMKQSASRHLINQLLQEMDGMSSQNEGLLIIGATNMPWNLDPAFRRPGRFDRILFVPPPDLATRESILQIKLSGKPTQGIDVKAVAKATEHFSGADLDALIDIATEQKLEAAFLAGAVQPLQQKDLLQAAKVHKPSTQEWFSTARNFALFANESGLYDDILSYLKIKK